MVAFVKKSILFYFLCVHGKTLFAEKASIQNIRLREVGRGGNAVKRAFLSFEKQEKGTSFQQQENAVIQNEAKVLSTYNEDKEYQQALLRTSATVALAAIFGVALMAVKGKSAGYEFFAGYLIEQSLSIDNLFVFIMLFEYFKIPLEQQNRVLSWGITGAIALRGLMIGVGVAALQKFHSVILVFASILIASSLNLLLEKEESSQEGHDGNLIMKISKFLFPNTSTELHGEKFFITSETGKKVATPLLLCLVCVEFSDFVFAVDSIPAVLGVSKDPLIVYASNIFAIMALRSLYKVVAKAVSSFRYLKPAVALVLAFVGSKMVAEYFHYDVGIGISLSVICFLLGSGIIASIWESKLRHQPADFVTVTTNPFTNTTFSFGR